MTAIINSQYILENVSNFTLSMFNVFLGFESEEARNKAIEQLKNIKIDAYSPREIQFPSDSGLTSISLFENYDS